MVERIIVIDQYCQDAFVLHHENSDSEIRNDVMNVIKEMSSELIHLLQTLLQSFLIIYDIKEKSSKDESHMMSDDMMRLTEALLQKTLNDLRASTDISFQVKYHETDQPLCGRQ